MSIFRLPVACLSLCAATAASAQWIPGSELTGQVIEIETAGVTNQVALEPGGMARLFTPGGKVYPATWSAADRKLCIAMGGRGQCFPYLNAFEAGRSVTLLGDCGTTSRVLAKTVNPPPPSRLGERG